MILTFFFYCIIIIISYNCSQNTKINYKVTLLKLLDDECDSKIDNYMFKLECIINPSPIFDLEFNLDLSSPKGMTAKCKLTDDVIDVIICQLNLKNYKLKNEKIIISGNELIKVNDEINILIEKLNQDWEVKFCSHLFLNINAFIFIFIIIFLDIF